MYFGGKEHKMYCSCCGEVIDQGDSLGDDVCDACFLMVNFREEDHIPNEDEDLTE